MRTLMMVAMLAAISGDALVTALLWIIIGGVVFWLVTWLISFIGLPEPFAKIAKVVIGLVAVVFLLNALLGLVGRPFIQF